MKKLLIIAIIIASGFSANAQVTAKGFFSPVTADMFSSGDKGLTGVALIRPEFTIAGNVIKPVFVDGKFSHFASSFGTRAGMGVSYSLYKLVNDQPYNVYSFAAQLSLATIEKPNAGLLITASAFDLYGLSPSLGFGYDFVKGLPFKQNYFLMWGISHTF